MSNFARWLTFFVLACFVSSLVAAPKVLTTIKPVHGLVASVMDGVGEPIQLVPDNMSPHIMQLKPSQVRQVEQAEVIFWIGPDLETFLVKLIQHQDKAHALVKAEGLTRLPQRSGQNWQHHHAHGDNHHHDHNHHGHDDPHIWLSPENAMAMLDMIAAKLSVIDADNAKIYQANAQNTKRKILQTKQKVYLQLEPWQKTPYIVFHDAYQYFELSFSIPAAGSIAVNPEVPLSGNALHKLRKQITAQNIKCVFTEPEFSHYPINNTLAGLQITVAELDPLGVHVQAGPDHYTHLIEAMGNKMVGCFEKLSPAQKP